MKQSLRNEIAAENAGLAAAEERGILIDEIAQDAKNLLSAARRSSDAKGLYLSGLYEDARQRAFAANENLRAVDFDRLVDAKTVTKKTAEIIEDHAPNAWSKPAPKYRVEQIQQGSNKRVIVTKTISDNGQQAESTKGTGKARSAKKGATMPKTAQKTCPVCKVEKTLSEFYKSSGTKDGHSFWCKDCNKAKAKARREARAAAEGSPKTTTPKAAKKDEAVPFEAPKDAKARKPLTDAQKAARAAKERERRAAKKAAEQTQAA